MESIKPQPDGNQLVPLPIPYPAGRDLVDGMLATFSNDEIKSSKHMMTVQKAKAKWGEVAVANGIALFAACCDLIHGDRNHAENEMTIVLNVILQRPKL